MANMRRKLLGLPETPTVTALDSSNRIANTAWARGIKLDDFAVPDDNTDLNVSIARHGLTPKLSNDATQFLNGIGGYSVPAGGGGGGGGVGGALVPLGTYNGSAVSSINALIRTASGQSGNLFQSDYKKYFIAFHSVVLSATGNVPAWRVSTDGSTFISTGSGTYVFEAGYAFGTTGSAQGNATGTSVLFRDPTGVPAQVANTSWRGEHFVYNPANTSFFTEFDGKHSLAEASQGLISLHWAGYYAATTAVVGLQLIPSNSGTISGEFTVYGIADSIGFVGGNKGVIQVVSTQTGAMATGSTLIPHDDTIPQNTEGDEYMTLSVTPTNAANKLRIEVVAQISDSLANAVVTVALFQDSGVGAIAAVADTGAVGTGTQVIVLNHYMTAGATSPTTFRVRIGPNAGTLTFNGQSGARRYGGVSVSGITITELAASVVGTGVVLLADLTASASASLNVTGIISSLYDNYEFVFNDFILSNNTILGIKYSTDNGATWAAGTNYDSTYGFSYASTSGGGSVPNAARMAFRDTATTWIATLGINGRLMLFNPLGASLHKAMHGHITLPDNSIGPLIMNLFGRFKTTTPINAIQVLPDAGTITSGRLRVYGWPRV